MAVSEDQEIQETLLTAEVVKHVTPGSEGPRIPLRRLRKQTAPASPQLCHGSGTDETIPSGPPPPPTLISSTERLEPKFQRDLLIFLQIPVGLTPRFLPEDATFSASSRQPNSVLPLVYRSGAVRLVPTGRLFTSAGARTIICSTRRGTAFKSKCSAPDSRERGAPSRTLPLK